MGFSPANCQGKPSSVTNTYRICSQVVLKTADSEWKRFSHRIDKVLTHKCGLPDLFAILFLIFQSILPGHRLMDFIDSTFANLSNLLKDVFPQSSFSTSLHRALFPVLAAY